MNHHIGRKPQHALRLRGHAPRSQARIGNALRDRAASDQDGGKAMRCPHTGVWLFDRPFADRFMRDGGTVLVKAHNDRIAGQGRLKLVTDGPVKAVVAAA